MEISSNKSKTEFVKLRKLNLQDVYYLMIDLRQTPQYALYMQKIGWGTEWENGNLYYIKKFPLFGSVIKFQRPKTIDHRDIDKVAKKHKAFEIIFEPKDDLQEITLKAHKYRQSKSPYLPSKTIHIDITKPHDVILKRMHHKTRYNIKTAEKNGIKIVRSNEIDIFADFWQKCAKTQRGMFLPQKKEITEIYNAFGKSAELLFAYQTENFQFPISNFQAQSAKLRLSIHKLSNSKLTGDSKLETGNLLACILLLHTPDISYYMYAASNDEGKKLFAPTLLVWEGIKSAKNRGAKVFDFEGIYDDRFPLPTWKGFSRFKKSFGGEEIMYPGTYIKFRLPI